MRQAGILLALALALLGAMALKGALLILPSPPSMQKATAFDANRATARLPRFPGSRASRWPGFRCGRTSAVNAA